VVEAEEIEGVEEIEATGDIGEIEVIGVIEVVEEIEGKGESAEAEDGTETTASLESKAAVVRGVNAQTKRKVRRKCTWIRQLASPQQTSKSASNVCSCKRKVIFLVIQDSTLALKHRQWEWGWEISETNPNQN
jgi:hypothetical protein